MVAILDARSAEDSSSSSEDIATQPQVKYLVTVAQVAVRGVLGRKKKAVRLLSIVFLRLRAPEIISKGPLLSSKNPCLPIDGT
jgi:hypothetical protein